MTPVQKIAVVCLITAVSWVAVISTAAIIIRVVTKTLFN